MSLKTTLPVDGTIASAALWGASVYGDLAAVTNIQVMPNKAPTATFDSIIGTYQNVAGWDFNAPKVSDTSRILVVPILTGYATGISGFVQTQWSIAVDGTDYPAAFYNWNAASDHRQVVGAVIIPNLVSGTKGYSIRGRVSGSGGGTPHMVHDASDRASLICFEMP